MPAKIGTKENPCTLENSVAEERGMKYCRCSKCDLIERSTFDFDFYETPDGKQLLCERCFGSWFNAGAFPTRRPLPN